MSLCAWSYNVATPQVQFMRLRPIPVERPGRPMCDIIAAVAQAFGVTVMALKSQQRHRTVAFARFAAFLMLREERHLSYSLIGRHLGNRDHSTVHHGVARARDFLIEDEDFAARYREARGR